MIWIVSGPSSAGKSWFLASARAQEVTGLPRGTRVIFPKDVGPDAPRPGQDAFVHYNVLRPFQRLARPQDVAIGPRLFESDSQWRAIVAIPSEKRAVIVVTDRATLIARVRARAEIERGEERQYGVAKWLRIYEAVDVDAVYRAWREELTRCAIPYVDVDGTAGH